MNRNKKKTSSSEEELFLFDDDVDTTTIIETLIKEEKHLEAARVIRKIQSQSQQSFFFDTDEYYRKILQKAELIERAVKELLSSPEKEVIDNDDDDNDDNDNDNDNDDDEWIKQGGSHRYSNYEYTIYYKIDDKARLTCRIESPVPTTLLVPLLSVLNESSLYQTWIPSWTTPIKLGIKESNQLLQDSRGHQIIQVQCHVGPWPIRVREACFSVLAVDDIETNGFIIATMTSLLSSSSTTTTTTINNANANANANANSNATKTPAATMNVIVEEEPAITDPVTKITKSVIKENENTTIATATYNNEDVLCGRGKGIREHPGNQLYNKLLREHYEEYANAPKGSKLSFVKIVVNTIRSQKPLGGRFLDLKNDSIVYTDIGDVRALNKTVRRDNLFHFFLFFLLSPFVESSIDICLFVSVDLGASFPRHEGC